jgi:hypothetical protein
MALLVALPAVAAAGDASALRVSVSALVGAAQLDPHLSDYRWDTATTARLGAQVFVERGRLLAGVRASRMQTTQASGIPGETRAAKAHLTAFELVAGARALSLLSVDVCALASGGLLHLGYDPDRASYVPLGGGPEIVVDYAPVDTWTAGAGLLLRRAVTSRLALGLHLERTYFALDTAHRAGAAITEQRETFGSWGAHLLLSWTAAGL